MDPAAILADVQIVISLGRLAVQVGIDSGPYVIQAYDIMFNKKALTPSERAAAIAEQKRLEALISTPSDDANGG